MIGEWDPGQIPKSSCRPLGVFASCGHLFGERPPASWLRPESERRDGGGTAASGHFVQRHSRSQPFHHPFPPEAVDHSTASGRNLNKIIHHHKRRQSTAFVGGAGLVTIVLWPRCSDWILTLKDSPSPSDERSFCTRQTGHQKGDHHCTSMSGSFQPRIGAPSDRSVLFFHSASFMCEFSRMRELTREPPSVSNMGSGRCCSSSLPCTRM